MTKKLISILNMFEVIERRHGRDDAELWLEREETMLSQSERRQLDFSLNRLDENEYEVLLSSESEVI
jgi:hypothetical protein